MAALAFREVAWSWFPTRLQGMASKGAGALLVLVLLAAVWRASPRSGWLDAAIAYGAWGALQTVICSAAYMIEPWLVPPGVGICSARIDFDLGALGLLFAAWFAVKSSSVKPYRSTEQD